MPTASIGIDHLLEIAKKPSLRILTRNVAILFLAQLEVKNDVFIDVLERFIEDLDALRDLFSCMRSLRSTKTGRGRNCASRCRSSTKRRTSRRRSHRSLRPRDKRQPQARSRKLSPEEPSLASRHRRRSGSGRRREPRPVARPHDECRRRRARRSGDREAAKLALPR